jgi:transposase-like protein
MTKRSRRNHSAVFKAKLALAAIKGDETLAQLTTRYDVHPNQIVQWKGQLLERAAEVFNGTGQAAEPGPDINTLHATIGQLALENDLLAGALGRSPGSSAKR